MNRSSYSRSISSLRFWRGLFGIQPDASLEGVESQAGDMVEV